jgi:mevalonate kinase
MPLFSAYAPGKIILFGEHAVVYGRPAIAVPVQQVQARAVVEPNLRAPTGQVRILAQTLQLDQTLDELPPDHPLAAAVWVVQRALGLSRSPACTIRVTSTIPVAAGLGSGAAVAVVMIRAYAAFLGRPLNDEQVSALAFEIEKLHHGTPSGIDNTVITYAQPVFFEKGQPIQSFSVAEGFTLVIGDSGIPSPTAVSVGDVRQAWQAEPERYEAYFDRIGAIVQQARQVIEHGPSHLLGTLMDENQAVLQQIGVSSPELDQLTAAARQAGALGAKLSGGGRGGNMIALAAPDTAAQIAQALHTGGAVSTLISEVR